MNESVDRNLKSEISSDSIPQSVIYSKASASIISQIPQEIKENPSGEVGIIGQNIKKTSPSLSHDFYNENLAGQMQPRNLADNLLECEIIVPSFTPSGSERPAPAGNEPDDARFNSINSFYTNDTHVNEAPMESRNEKEWPSPNIDTFEVYDGNSIEAGYFVTLIGTKIKKVGPWDNYILGVTSDKTNESGLTPVILWGKVVVKDDGRCMPNGFCCPNTLGIAIPWSSGYRVMERKGPDEILILLK